MKFIIIFITILPLFVACNLPADQRVILGEGTTENSNPFTDGAVSTPTPTPTATPESSSTSVSTPTIPTDVSSSCIFSKDGLSGYKSNHSHIGKFSLCQSTSDPKKIYVQLQTPLTSVRLCIIPTYKNQSGYVYLGEPRCLYVPSATAITPVLLKTNRINYTNITPNSVIIMKDEVHSYGPPYGYPATAILSPDAYLFCANWLASHYGDTSYCQAFDAVGAFVLYPF